MLLIFLFSLHSRWESLAKHIILMHSILSFFLLNIPCKFISIYHKCYRSSWHSSAYFQYFLYLQWIIQHFCWHIGTAILVLPENANIFKKHFIIKKKKKINLFSLMFPYSYSHFKSLGEVVFNNL